MFTTAEVRSLAVGGRQLRVAVRPGLRLTTGARRPPLLLINGIGASLELLEPFVREVDPGVDVIRFDPPGVGGSAVPSGRAGAGRGRLPGRAVIWNLRGLSCQAPAGPR